MGLYSRGTCTVVLYSRDCKIGTFYSRGIVWYWDCTLGDSWGRDCKIGGLYRTVGGLYVGRIVGGLAKVRLFNRETIPKGDFDGREFYFQSSYTSNLFPGEDI